MVVCAQLGISMKFEKPLSISTNIYMYSIYNYGANKVFPISG